MPNVMNEYINFNVKCLQNYYKLIYGRKYDKAISNKYIDTYIYVRYGNYIDEESVKLNILKKPLMILYLFLQQVKMESIISKKN